MSSTGGTGGTKRAPSEKGKKNNEKKKKQFYYDKGKRSQNKPSEKVLLTPEQLKALDLRDTTTPLWKLPYEEQIAHKSEFLEDCFKKLRDEIMSFSLPNDARATKYIEEIQAECTEKLCCAYDGVIPAPTLQGYRNKWQLTAGFDADGKKCLGFVAGAWSDGVNGTTAPIGNCIPISDEGKLVSQRLNEYVIQSDLSCYHSSTGGFWRQVTVRQNLDKEMLVDVQVNPTGLSKEQLDEEKKKLVEFVTKLNEDELKSINTKIASLLWQEWAKISSVASYDTPRELLYGVDHLYETLCGVKFRISADSFFQTNTKAAEVLYTKVADLCGVLPAAGGYNSAGTVIYDICCGTGSIGISISKLSNNPQLNIVGVESVASAIHDAKHNSEVNHIQNTAWHVGRAEDLLPKLFSEEYKRFIRRNLIGVIDPPRPGLHKSAVRAIRRCRGLDRLIYVSCNAETLVRDAALLCKPEKGQRMPPFKPIRALGVDLFPHTDHVEAIIVFQRCKFVHVPEDFDNSSGDEASKSAATTTTTTESGTDQKESKGKEEEDKEEKSNA
eukprot:TRINITY_DN9146_c0_g1_i2.p1 TRINITY_DN9146_c0_g1~~TRINITY_DN9146_c0_g1_i2.p1  ORF type:complete len:574 (+),score=148.11 TRINITY_DN9146_c0_g1_i2:62-1723(+)